MFRPVALCYAGADAGWLPGGTPQVANHLTQPLGGSGLLFTRGGGGRGVGELIRNVGEVDFEVMDENVVHVRSGHRSTNRRPLKEACQGNFGGCW